ncbi:MAG TPA: hypothetical protein VK419_15010 [Bryobacteraceae bacterium]|nr:hypothetical protein [Bryobacteraceae bacterium]
MVFRAALALLPVLAFAQTPPPDVEQALRARVTQFFQYHVEGGPSFRKALELVAEDTKDYYFGAQKFQFKSFHIDTVKFEDNFTKAQVTVTGERVWQPRPDFPPTLITTPMLTLWKIENGKWVWYYNPDNEWLTPMGPSDRSKIQTPMPSTVPRFDAGQIASAARGILQQSSIDKNVVTLAADKPSSDQVVFHNGQPGTVKLVLQPPPSIAGFTATLDKAELNANENAVLKFHYEPSDKQTAPPVELNYRFYVQPLDRAFGVTVKFDRPANH